MGHTHDHAHDHNPYYLDQLCTVGVSAALGAVAILLWRSGALGILARVFQDAVLVGGIALLIVALLRGVALWKTAGRASAHEHEHHDHDHGPGCAHEHHSDQDHDHEHGPACDHEHGPAHAAHDHGHDHDHGWAPVKYVVLLLPIALFFLKMPNEKFNNLYNNCNIKRAAGTLAPLLFEWMPGGYESIFGSAQDRFERSNPALSSIALTALANRGHVNLGFKELSDAAMNQQARQYYEGKTASLKGQFMTGINDRTFTMVRMKITCCGADAIPVKVIILSPEPVADIAPLTWIKVTGQIQFRPRRDGAEFLPVLQLAGREGIEEVPPDKNPYIY